MNAMKPLYDGKDKRWFVKYKLANGQTFFMSFSVFDSCRTRDGWTNWWNIAMCVVSKRKNIDRVFDECVLSGKDPFQTFCVARKAFSVLEEHIFRTSYWSGYTNIVCVSWLDNRRRDLYARFLCPKGYRFSMIDGHSKVLMKVYPPCVEETSNTQEALT